MVGLGLFCLCWVAVLPGHFYQHVLDTFMLVVVVAVAIQTPLDTAGTLHPLGGGQTEGNASRACPGECSTKTTADKTGTLQVLTLLADRECCQC